MMWKMSNGNWFVEGLKDHYLILATAEVTLESVNEPVII